MSKKILHLIPALAQGGAERMLLKILEHENECVINSAVVSRGKYNTENVKLINFFGFIGFIKLLLYIKKEKPDVIVGWLYSCNLIVCFLSLFHYKCKFYHNFRNVVDSSNTPNSKRKLFLAFLSTFSKYRKISCIYNSFNGLNSYSNYLDESIDAQVIPNGFIQVGKLENSDSSDIIKNQLQDKEFDLVISFPARFDPAKNHSFLLSVVKQVWTLHPDKSIAVILCGRGVPDGLESKCKAIQADSKVEFFLYDAVSHLGFLYAYSDLIFISSVTEAFPNVIGEAMINDCFVISSDVGDCKKILGNADWIYKVDDYSGAVGLIDSFINMTNFERHSKIEENKARVLENYHIGTIVNKYNEL
ncbi:glycosyltransferase [Vibrio breoganii]